MVRRLFCRAVIASILLGAVSAQAGFGFSTSGAATGIIAPADARPNKLESDTSVFVWLEGDGAQTGPVDVDHDGSDIDYPADAPTAASVYGPFCSYLIHMDSVRANRTVTLTGAVTFVGKIIGVIFSAPNLQASNHLGEPTAYAGGNGHLESDEDSFSISGSTLTFTLVANSGKTDQIRVLTSVPEPGTMGAFLLIGLSTMGMRRLRRRTV